MIGGIMLVTLQVTKEFAKLIKWISSGVSTDSSRVSILYFKVESPEIVATNGYVIHKATFENAEKLTAIIEDGFYKLVVLKKDILVLEKAEEEIEIKFPSLENVWSEPDQIRSAPMHIFEGDYRVNASLYFNTRFVTDAISLMGENESGYPSNHMCEIVIGNHNRSFYLGMRDFTYLVQETSHLYAKLEAIIMPMRGGLERSIDLQRCEPKKEETGISVQKTAGEIQEILARTGARTVVIEFGDDRIPDAIIFQIAIGSNIFTFRLP
jgi:hypothetical protein